MFTSLRRRSRVRAGKWSRNASITCEYLPFRSIAGRLTDDIYGISPDQEPQQAIELGEAIASLSVSALNGALREIGSKVRHAANAPSYSTDQESALSSRTMQVHSAPYSASKRASLPGSTALSRKRVRGTWRSRYASYVFY